MNTYYLTQPFGLIATMIAILWPSRCNGPHGSFTR